MNGAKNNKKLFLTFDDGPVQPHTKEILDLLGKFGAKATFFVCGKNVLRFEQLTRRIVQEGHAIGNHSYSHTFFFPCGNFFFRNFFSKEIEKTTQIIQRITGKKTNLFRPPRGILTKDLQKYLKEYKIILWDVDILDWLKLPAKFILKRALKKIKSGDIILLHDRSALSFLPLLLENLKDRGFIFEKIC